MRYDPKEHHRRSVRLKGYDYNQAGAYFVTIVTQNHHCIFGEIINGIMRLNNAGQMSQIVWDELPVFYSGVDIDTFIVMPNHIHGIIVLTRPEIPSHLVGATPCGCPLNTPCGCPLNTPCGCPLNTPCACPDVEQPQGVAPTIRQTRGSVPTGGLSLPDVVHRFKTMTTKRYIDGVKQMNWQPFDGKLWQRNYYEHVIRNEDELNSIREYIVNNPLQWEMDQENPVVGAVPPCLP